jgi:hypothetical protein
MASGVVVGRIDPGVGTPQLINSTQLANLINVYPSYPIRPATTITISNIAIAPTTQAIAANNLRAFPWELRRAVTISQLRQEVTAVAAATTFRLGLYLDDGTGYPGGLVSNSDTVTLDSATTGVRLYDPPDITLQPGLLWLVINSNGNATIRAVPTAGLSAVLGANPAGGANSHYTCWNVAQAYAALPATFPAGGTRTANINAPWTMFTVA